MRVLRCGIAGLFFFSSRRRHTRCALVTGVQTCALPIFHERQHVGDRQQPDDVIAIGQPLAALGRRGDRSVRGVAHRALCGHRYSPAAPCGGYNVLADPRTTVAWLDSSMPLPRSEEHTSELQSLMRLSYAVFCLKKKK